VLEPGEAVGSERVKAAVAPGLSLAYHSSFEASPDAVERLPGGARWREQVETLPAERRHLAVHVGHLLAPNAMDRSVLDEALTLTSALTFTGTSDEVGQRLDAMAAAGVTEFVYQPAGPDIERELSAFASAAAAFMSE
jgi:5,10-methylenetetrahydromethanopterin reductase